MKEPLGDGKYAGSISGETWPDTSSYKQLVYGWHLLFAEIHEFQNSCTNLVEVVVEVQNSQVLLHPLIPPCTSALLVSPGVEST